MKLFVVAHSVAGVPMVREPAECAQWVVMPLVGTARAVVRWRRCDAVVSCRPCRLIVDSRELRFVCRSH
ncbi:MAG TPA: hypothetical protein VLE45_06965, partial [Burkholderiaceae bacterium]|nr:hypothetical protein [Burkholderiaceae bacterium]